MEEPLRGRRAAATRRGPGPVAKQFQKMNILTVGDDYRFCSGVARAGEAHQLAVSIFWSPDGLSLVSKSEFDAAIVDAALWSFVRPIFERWQRLQVVIIRGGRLLDRSLSLSSSIELQQVAETASPEAVLASLADFVQKQHMQRSLEPVSSPIETEAIASI